jgi:hypothetical protein
MNNFKEELEEIKQACSFPDWDGYGALPLNETSVRLAKEFIKRVMELYPELPYPELCPEPDGCLGFDWRQNLHQFAVSIDAQYLLSYTHRHPNYKSTCGDIGYNKKQSPLLLKRYFELLTGKDNPND